MSMKQNSKKIGLIGAICSFAAIYAASSAPVPLYTAYRQLIGLSNADLSLSSVLYFVGTVIALLFLARVSNYAGRKPVVLAALMLSAIGCMLFCFLSSAPLFMVARLVQGLSCGLGSSCMAAYIVDSAQGKVGTIATSSAPMIGLAVGSFGSGALVQYGTGSLSHIFVVIMLFLCLCAMMIVCGKETIETHPGALASLAPEIRAPKQVRELLPAASAVFVGTWAIGGFYQAFSAPLASEQLGTSNVMVAAAVFACLQAPNILGSTLAGKLKSEKAQQLGMTAFFISILAVVLSLAKGSVGYFLLASALAGASWGLGYAGSMQGILPRTAPEDRAGVLSTIYIISYSGAAIPNLVVGRVSGRFNLLQIAMGYGALVFLTWCAAMLLSMRQCKSRKEHFNEI